MFQFDKIKLVVWDMDETFWHGTISEGAVTIPNENITLLKRLTDIGIINSICSKNDWRTVEAELDKYNLLEYFVFLSVNWSPKGGRLLQLISDMQLRPENVLFLDDNPSNIEEARHFCNGIMTGDPSDISALINNANACAKRDVEHKRLKQYRLLEEKHTSKAKYSSNEEFLMQSNIQLAINNDCPVQLERIHDLVMRSNQLNYTKVRSSQEELKKLFEDKTVKSGYVSVKDRFGDYGIVGFYAFKDNELLHFVFSCRILGMGIEQYVYNELNRPKLTVVGEVVSDLTCTVKPKWINQNPIEDAEDKMAIRALKEHMVLIKGPCDLFQIYPYIANTELFDTEFTYITEKGVNIESTSHTTHMVEAERLNEQQKKRIIDEVPFVDADIYSNKLYTQPYKVVVISLISDPNLGVYQRKETGEQLAFLEYTQPITDPNNWEGLIYGTLLTNNFKFTREILDNFSRNWDFAGRNSVEKTVENLRYIREHLRENCLLVVMLGGELEYEKNTAEAYKDRHIVHRELNKAVREYANTQANIRLLDVNKYLVDQSSFYDHFNHYIKPVYYQMASELVEIINEYTGSQIKETGKWKMSMIRAKEIMASVYYKIKGKKKNGRKKNGRKKNS